jgi:hypothetical protein
MTVFDMGMLSEVQFITSTKNSDVLIEHLITKW